MSAILDQQALLDRVDNDWDFLAEMAVMLESDGRALLQDVRQAVAMGDAPAVGRAAHTLKGLVSNFCSADTHAAALALEQLGKSGDLAPAPTAVMTLQERIEALTAALNEFLATRPR